MREKGLILYYHEKGVPQILLEELINVYGSINDYLESGDRAPQKYIEQFSHRPTDYELENIIKSFESRNIHLIFRGDEDFPKDLLNLDDIPLLLYAKGNYELKDQLALGVVGSRKCTDYGVWATQKIVRELVDYDITIISGLAYGIDSVAHDTALKAGGRTIGVIGNGIDVVYPKSNETLYKRMEENGLILSEFPSWAKPLPHHFPYRNRIISGLSLGILVVEAQKKSGTMITAGHALSQGKEVFCIPGNINSAHSAGCHQLIKDGAVLTTSIDDILEEIAVIDLRGKKQKRKQEHLLSAEEEILLDCLELKPLSMDELIEDSGLQADIVYRNITLLEMRGFVSVRGGLCLLTQ